MTEINRQEIANRAARVRSRTCEPNTDHEAYALALDTQTLLRELEQTKANASLLYGQLKSARAEVERLRAENVKVGRQALLDYRDANHRHNDRAPGWCVCGDIWVRDGLDDEPCDEYQGLTETADQRGGA